VERSFAHLCDTGGARRTWLRGLQKVQKRYLSVAMAHNLGRILRSLLGAGKPRHLAVLAERLCFIHLVIRFSRRISCSVSYDSVATKQTHFHPTLFSAA